MTHLKVKKSLALIIALAIFVSCAAVNRLNFLSPKDEVAIGKQTAQEVERSLKMYCDPIVLAYIDSLGQAMVRASSLSQFQYHFKVVDAPEVNAFALPGGFLYVNRGLIKAASTESELAGVIGHEIGHVVGHHGARQISKRYGFAVLVDMIAGRGETSLAREIAAQFAPFGTGLALLKYGRLAEREADEFAVQCAVNAGIDPEGVARFFQTLLTLHNSEPKGVEVRFATHPPTQARIDFVRAEIAKLPPTDGLKKTSVRFDQIRARVLARR